MRCRCSLAKLAFALIAILIFILILSSLNCITWKLERKLSPEIWTWYDLHMLFMQAKAPKQIFLDRPTEALLFLRLSKSAQEKYMGQFWEMRAEGLKDIFQERVDAANEWFHSENHLAGWRTDRGRVLLLCGPPIDIQFVYRGNAHIWELEEGQIYDESDYYQVWLYYHNNIYIPYYFSYSRMDTWRLSVQYNSADQIDFENEMKKFWAPSDQGWEMIYQLYMASRTRE